jgi:hypothetical protein
MARGKNIQVINYCEAVKRELSDMKERVDALREGLDRTYGSESSMVRAHETHLLELADMIDWKLHILLGNCPSESTSEGELIGRVASTP